jgi:hypothetical protein
MYYLAVIWLFAFIYALYVGNFIGAIYALAGAIISASWKFIWDYSKGEKFLHRIVVPIIITLFVIGGSTFVIEIVKGIEISTEKYKNLKEISKSTPEIIKLIKDGMKDEKISVVEYYDIQEQYKKISKDKSKKALRGE